MPAYDFIIIGAGIAGLSVAIEALKRNKALKILIIEKYTEAGGRMATYTTKVDGQTISYEAGAGRIHSSHRRLLRLIKQHKMTTSPIPTESLYRAHGSTTSAPNYFDDAWANICDVFRKLPKETLRSKTLREITIETMGPERAIQLLDRDPYRAELEIMSAESGLDLFKSMETGSWLHLNEGFTSLIESMTKEAEKLGAKFLYNVEVQRIELNKDIYTVSGIKNKKYVQNQCTRVILAVPSNALTKIFPFSADHPLIKCVRMEPLLRVYSVYKDSSWFPTSKVVTNTPLRYIIPINKEKGVIMSTYLDSRDIEQWADLHKTDNVDKLAFKIRCETQTLFPELEIPKAIYTKAHFWRDGCTYWLPGTYNYKKMSALALHPMPETHPRLHIVGESFSEQQQWIEGSLEHAERLMDLITQDTE